MPNRKSKGIRRIVSFSDAEAAAKLVLENSHSVREAAKAYNMNYITLFRFVKKIKNGEKPTVGYNPHTRIFSPKQEDEIVNYLLSSSDNLYGLSNFGLRRFAYLLAVQYEVNYPKSWDAKRIASTGWCDGFMRRHPKLSLRTRKKTFNPEEISVNTDGVYSFFDQLYALMRKHNFLPQDIYNLDQIGVSSCHTAGQDPAPRASISGDVTALPGLSIVNVALAINAIGHYVPPMFLYPRMQMTRTYLNGGPTGAVGVANYCGAMTQDHLLDYLKHFSLFAKPSSKQKILLILANRFSQIDESVLDYCESVGIVLLTLPPDCCEKLQPLDRCVVRPFQAFYKSACDTWLANNPGQIISIDHVAAIVAKALPRAATPLNVMEGFRVCGIYPLDRDNCPEEDFVGLSRRNNITAQEPCVAEERNSGAEDRFKEEKAREEHSDEETLSNEPLSPEMNLWIDEPETKYQLTALESDITANGSENDSNVPEKQRGLGTECMSSLTEEGNSAGNGRLAALGTQDGEGSTVKQEPGATRDRRIRKSVDLSEYDVSISWKRKNGRGTRGRGTGRGRGRPRKVVPEEQPNQEGKRKRGRPRGSGKRGGATSSYIKEEVVEQCPEEMILGD